MIVTLLLIAAVPPADDLASFSLPPASRAHRMSVAGTRASKPSRYRVTTDGDPRVTSKDRAFAADGSYCNVVGAKRCTSHGRRIFSTDFTD